MTTEEFQALRPGRCFIHQAKDGGPKKQFCILKKEGETLIAHLRNDPDFLVHFYPRQAAQLTKLEGVTAKPVEAIAQSQGIPILPAAVPSYATKTVHIAFEGVLAQGRLATAEPGPPVVGSIDFLHTLRAAGIHVVISTNRPAYVVRNWLQLHSGSYHLEDTEISHAAPDGADLYLSVNVRQFDGVFPEELLQ
jgi:hypothetical protein